MTDSGDYSFPGSSVKFDDSDSNERATVLPNVVEPSGGGCESALPNLSHRELGDAHRVPVLGRGATNADLTLSV